ncbi:MAG: hypothetical protein ABJP34_06165 [Erythrobacter sp.]
MGAYVLIAIVAIVVWGVLRFNKQQIAKETDIDLRQNQALIEAETERDELRERVKVLERIVTDSNTPSAQKVQKLSDEIEQLRDDTK